MSLYSTRTPKQPPEKTLEKARNPWAVRGKCTRVNRPALNTVDWWWITDEWDLILCFCTMSKIHLHHQMSYYKVYKKGFFHLKSHVDNWCYSHLSWVMTVLCTTADVLFKALQVASYLLLLGPSCNRKERLHTMIWAPCWTLSYCLCLQEVKPMESTERVCRHGAANCS